jgi:signal-transduction protein with cAMP-binding, CBS, and nucleotidyltransferase domain
MALACSSGSTSVGRRASPKGSAIGVHRKLCWIALGSEGWLEQRFATDQDNRIIFSIRSELPPQRVRERLLAFAAAVNRTLDRCGFPLCKGNIMAGNRRWCLSLAEWRAQFSAWIGNTDPRSGPQLGHLFRFSSGVR